MNLYELTEEAKALEDLIANACDPETGELPENVLQIIEEWSAESEAALSVKLEAIGRLYRNLEAKAKAFSEEAERLAKIKRAAEAKASRLKEWTKFCLESQGFTKQEAGVFTFAIQKNGGKRPVKLCVDLDPKTLPEQFQRVTVTADSEAIRAALESGETLDFAEFGEVGTHLRIR